MKNKLLFVFSGIGILLGCAAAVVFAIEKPAQPPLFNPPSNPYSAGIYAEGIVESEQASGSNISVYPEVSGTVKRIFVVEGEQVRAGQPLLLIDDSVQRATTEQQAITSTGCPCVARGAPGAAEKRESGDCRCTGKGSEGLFEDSNG